MRTRPPRVSSESDKTPNVQTASFPAPTNGLVTNALLGQAAGATVFKNFWPGRQGIEPRGGLQELCNVPTKVETLFQHRGSGKFYAATASAIYEFNDSSSGSLSSVLTGFTGGDWSTYETRTSGGTFLTICNGLDGVRQFNGTSWSTPTITGPTPSTLSFVWGYRTRMLFVQKDTMTFWYGGPDSIAGTFTSQSLGSVFRNGGALIAGGTWSSDSGDGMDDRCVFITSGGEVAIYEGNPADATWSKVGVYDLGKVLGVKGIMNLSGDLVIATADGIIPVSGLVGKDPSDLRSIALTDAISPTWLNAVNLGATDWRVTKWPRGGMLIAAPLTSDADEPAVYVANMASRAWAEITGWDVGDLEALGDNLYLGGIDGKIYRAWAGGTDAGTPFVCQVQFPYQDLGDPTGQKIAGHIRGVWKIRTTILPKITLAVDYMDRFPGAPNASGAVSGATSEWDLADWDVSEWGSTDEEYTVHAKWRGTSGIGFAFAPQVQLVSSGVARLAALLERVDMTYMAGGSVA